MNNARRRKARRMALHEGVQIRSRGRCEWEDHMPRCPLTGLQMAHLEGVGAGGRASADTLDNVAWLCLGHHDLLDGRVGSGAAVPGARRAMGGLLRAVIRLRQQVPR